MSINSPIPARIVQGLAAIVCAFAYITPHKIWIFFGRCFGRLFHRVLKRHRQYALANVRFAYGDEKSDEEYQEIVRQSFIQLGMSVFDGVRSPGFVLSGLEKPAKKISYEGLEHYEAAQKMGKGILLLNAHFNSVELANLFYVHKTGRKLNFILRRFDNPHLQNLLMAHNNKFGINLLYKQNGLRPAVKNVVKGQDLVIFPDQRSNLKEGVVSSIFGKKATTLSILPQLAIKLGCPILPMFIFRQEDHVSQKLVFFPPIIASPDSTVEEITQLQNDAIEKAVRMAPDHWLWLHRRWKEDFPEIYQ